MKQTAGKLYYYQRSEHSCPPSPPFPMATADHDVSRLSGEIDWLTFQTLCHLTSHISIKTKDGAKITEEWCEKSRVFSAGSQHHMIWYFVLRKLRTFWTLPHIALVVFLAFHDVTSDKSFNLNLFISDKLQFVSHKIRWCQFCSFATVQFNFKFLKTQNS